MKKKIEEKLEAVLDELLTYALQTETDETNFIFKKEVAQLAINYMKVKSSEEEGAFFKEFERTEEDEEIPEEELETEILEAHKKLLGKRRKK